MLSKIKIKDIFDNKNEIWYSNKTKWWKYL